MYYGSETAHRNGHFINCICSSERQRRVDADVRLSPAMTIILKVWRHIGNPTPSVDAYLLKNNPAKFHPAPIWNDGALGFLHQEVIL